MSETRRTVNRWFAFLYRTRFKVAKGDTPILNLSLIFALLTVFSAPWLAVAGLMVALALGYRFSIERNASGFSGSFNEVVHTAAENVRSMVGEESAENKESEENEAE